MIDCKGLTYWIWCALWPSLRLVLLLRPGEQALAMPERGDRYYKWWKLNLYQSARRIISQGSGGIPTVVVGVASILLAILLALFQQEWMTWWACLLFTVPAAYIFALAVCYTAYLALRAQPPAEYANTVLAGRSTAAAIVVTAYEVRAVCQEFLDSVREVEEDLTTVSDGQRQGYSKVGVIGALEYVASNKERIKEWVGRYKLGLIHREQTLERVERMKAVLADRLGIPRRRLCDYVLQYSPRIQIDLSRKFGENWESLLATADDMFQNDSDEYLKRLRALILQNRRILDKAKSRKMLQERLLDIGNEGQDLELLDWVHRFASMHSSSGSALQYAQAISHVVRTQGGDVRQAKQLVSNLVFLYRKQRAYPGVEPHEVCLAIIDALRNDQANEGHFNMDDCKDQQSALEAIREGEKSIGKLLEKNHSNQYVLALKNLSTTLERFIARCREGIVDRFRDYADKFFENAGENGSFVVTSGYSKTVRQALKGLPRQMRERIRVFVMSPSSGSGEDLDARKMVYELVEDPEFQGFVVGRGDGDALVGLLRDGDHVLVTLGVECFDSSMRVVHPIVDRKGVASLRGALGECQCKYQIVFLAETYKQRDDLLGEDLFFRHHMDGLAIHQADVILTEREVLRH